MSTTPVSASSIYQELQAYFQQRGSDVQQLGNDLLSGSIANAQQDFNALLTLGQSGPSAKGDVFESKVREQDFNAIGQALNSGDLAGAQQAFAQLQSTFHHKHFYPLPPSPGPAPAATASFPSSSVGSGGSIYQQLRAFYQQRRADVQQIGQDLTAGNLASALQAYNALEALGQGGPFKSGGAFNNKQREQDLNAIGQALNSGDLAGAQQAFAQLEATFQKFHPMPPVYGPPSTTAGMSNSPSSGALEGALLDTTG